MSTARPPRKQATKRSPAKQEAVQDDGGQALLLSVVLNDDDIEPILTPCPAWCVQEHVASATQTPTHWSKAYRARSSMMRGYYPPKAEQAYAHLTLRLREPVDTRRHVMIQQVWGDESGEPLIRNEWELTIEEARNLIVALERVIEASLT